MSYFPRQSDDSNPFAQTISDTDNISFSSGRFGNVSETWLDNDYGNNGHSFTGKGFIFCSLSPYVNAAMSFNINDNSAHYTAGEYIYYPNSSRAISDDEAISYGNNTERFMYSGGLSSNIKENSRVNVIRME